MQDPEHEAHELMTHGVTICLGVGLDLIPRMIFGIHPTDVLSILHGEIVGSDGREVISVSRLDRRTGLWSGLFVQEAGRFPMPASGMSMNPVDVAKDLLERFGE